MITYYIDEMLPCLKEVATGDIFDTEALPVKRKSVLAKFNQRTGWYINWAKFEKDVEVYALVLKGSFDIQGLIAVQNDDVSKALELRWACVAPENNIWRYGKKRFSGVGGHLFAMAADLSVQRGYEGFLVGEAADQDLFEYYIREYGASPLPPRNNPYRLMFSDKATETIRRIYTYEWTDDFL